MLIQAALWLFAAPAAGAAHQTPVWDAAAAEHLLNRAGFGARTAEVEAAVAAGLEATVERLLAPSDTWEMPAFEPIVEPEQKVMKELAQEERQKIQRDVRERDRRQLIAGTIWWYGRMASGQDPLLEKMTLFWHGFFTTSVEDSKQSYMLLRQNELLRRNALGSYATLLREIVRDPAMLTYLDNQVNRKGKPNENLARELMELFSLGEGNYTEQDVKEAARALTGRGNDRLGRYRLDKKQHDDGEKTILGRTGNFGGEELAEILLEQDACARHVARRLLAWFEGVDPAPERVEEYAGRLRAERYELRPFLRKLFTDPRFYRDEIVGARVLSPVEFMVGVARRADVGAAPVVIGSGASLLGQRLFAPPTVKGWEEGWAWISTSTFMQRGNLAGYLLGVVRLDDIASMADVESEMAAEAAASAAQAEGAMQGEGAMQDAVQGDGPMQDGAKSEPAMREGTSDATKDAPKAGTKDEAVKRDAPPKAKAPKAGSQELEFLRRAESGGWVPTLNLRLRLQRAGAQSDEQIVDKLLADLLAIQAGPETRARLVEHLARERAERKIEPGKLLADEDEAERVLRRLAHLILSLPEAQLG